MANQAWFRRSDGVEMTAMEGTPAFNAMARDGSFTRIEKAGGKSAPAADVKEKRDRSAMTKAQLLEEAKDLGIEVNPKAPKADIIEVLDSATDGRIGEADPPADEPPADDPKTDLSKLSKKQLEVEAVNRGICDIPAAAAMKKAELLEAIEAADSGE